MSAAARQSHPIVQSTILNRMVVALVDALSFINVVGEVLLVATPLNPRDGFDRMRCMRTCAQDTRCGIFVWDASTTPSCHLVVPPTSPDAQPITVAASMSVYISQRFRGKKLVILRNFQALTFVETKSMCSSQNADLVLPPVTEREMTMLCFRSDKRKYVDLTWTSSGPDIYEDGTGLQFTESDLSWEPENPQKRPGEIRMMISGNCLYKDLYGNDANDNEKTQEVFCVVD